MTIKCANCETSINVSDDQFGKPCECPKCDAILLLPRLKGEGDGELTVEAVSFDRLKEELIEQIRSEVNQDITDKVREEHAAISATDNNEGMVSESLKDELEKIAEAKVTTVSSGVDVEALKSQLRDEILQEVRKEIGSGATTSVESVAFTQALDALSSRLSTQAPTIPLSDPDAALTVAKPPKPRRKPFQPHREEVELPATAQEAYPAVEAEEPDIKRVIALNSGENENLQAFLEEFASVEGRLVMFEPSQSVKDVGMWRKARVWVVVTEEKIILGAFGRNPFKQEIGLDQVGESFWNEFTSEVVFVPYQASDGAFRSIKLTEERGCYLLGLIHHGIPAAS